MAIIFLREKRTQKSLIIVFVLIVLATAFIIWQGLFKQETEIYLGEEELEFIPREIKIDFSLLESSALEALQPFSEIESLPEGATSTEEGVELPSEFGRENPFIPY